MAPVKPHFCVFFTLEVAGFSWEFWECSWFPRIVVVFTSELKQTACSDVQTVRKYPPLLVTPLKWFFTVLYMRSGCSGTLPDGPFHVRKHAGGESCAWVLGQFVPLSTLSPVLGAMKSAPRKRGRNPWFPPDCLETKPGNTTPPCPAGSHSVCLKIPIDLCNSLNNECGFLVRSPERMMLFLSLWALLFSLWFLS